MSGRQKSGAKKRRPVQRDRTVTTLAADPDTPFLVPTTTEEPASHFHPHPHQPFGNNNTGVPGAGGFVGGGFGMAPAYAPFGSYQAGGSGPGGGGGFNQHQPMHPNSFAASQPQPYFSPQITQQQQQQQQHYPPSKNPHGQHQQQQQMNDLERLENLKAVIKNGQHEFFQPVPQPDHLAGVWLGPRKPPSASIPGAAHVPPHPEQIPDDRDRPLSSSMHTGASNGNGNNNGGASHFRRAPLRPEGSLASTVSITSSDGGRRSGPGDDKDAKDVSGTRKLAPQNSTGSVTSNNDSQATPRRRSDAQEKLNCSGQQQQQQPLSRNGSLTDPAGTPYGSSTSSSARDPLPFQRSRTGSTASQAPSGGRTRPTFDSTGSRPDADRDRDRDRPATDMTMSSPTLRRPGPGNSPSKLDARDRDQDKDRDRDRERDEPSRFSRDGRDSAWSSAGDRPGPLPPVDDRRGRFDPPRGASGPEPAARLTDPRDVPRSSTFERERDLDRDKDRGIYYHDKDAPWERADDRSRRPPPPPLARRLEPSRSQDDLMNVDRRDPYPPSAPDRRADPTPLSSASSSRPLSASTNTSVNDRDRDYRAPLPPPQGSGTSRPQDPRDDRGMPPPDSRSRASLDARPPFGADRDVSRPRIDSNVDDRRVPPSPGKHEVDRDTRGRGPLPASPRQLPIDRERERERAPVPPSPKGSARGPLPPPPERRQLSVSNSFDDRRPVPGSATALDDRRPPPASAPVDDRGPPSRQTSGNISANDSRAPPVLEPRSTQPPPRAPSPPRNQPRPLGDRLRPPIPASASSTTPLQDRLSNPGPPRPTGPPLLDRLSNPKPPDANERPTRPGPAQPPPPPRDAQPPRQTAPLPDRRPKIEPIDDSPSKLLAEAARRHSPPRSSLDERVRRDGYRTPPPAHGRALPPEGASYGGGSGLPPRAASLAREDHRPFPPKLPLSPVSRPGDYRYSRDPRDDLDRNYRPPPPRPYDDRRPDDMDVDRPLRRGPEPPLPASRPPIDDRGRDPTPRLYDRPADVAYPPASADPRYDARRDYYDDKPPFRADPPPRGRTWDARDNWDRDRPPPPPAALPDREPRYYSRDAHRLSNGWETKEEHDRRAASPVPSHRSYDGAAYPMASRLADPYPADDRARGSYPPRDLEPRRYPDPAPPPPPAYSRVRPRSPSPLRRTPSADDLRPPAKRMRDDPYPDPYYPPPRRDSVPLSASYPPPPPRRAASPLGGYYDRPPAPYVPGPRDSRDYPPPARDGPVDRAGYSTSSTYDRRPDVVRPRSPLPPPVYGRDTYDRPPLRDDRRYPPPSSR